MADTMERWLEHLENLLESVTTRPEQHLSEINLIGEQELRRLLVDWNETSQKFPTGQSMHQLFEEQVTRTPEATALVWQEQRLTYRELNERANRIAQLEAEKAAAEAARRADRPATQGMIELYSQVLGVDFAWTQLKIALAEGVHAGE